MLTPRHSPLAAHSLAIVLILVGLIGATLVLIHRHQRRNHHLVVHPGTIAGVVALTSHSGFGELLYPYDNADAMRRKLGHLRFSLDRRTGAVIADEYGYLGDHDNDSAGESETEKERTLEGGEGSGSVEKLEVDVEKAESEGLMEKERAMKRSSFPVDIPYEHEPFVPPRTPPGKF